MLENDSFGWALPESLYSRGTPFGSYHASRCLVRLRSDVQASMDCLIEGEAGSVTTPWEAVNAFSTYLHETIHWWQHIGSTLGLMLTFASPTQAHLNHDRLKKAISEIGPYKSLRQLCQTPPPHIGTEELDNLNIILNNWHDIEFCRQFILKPACAHDLVQNPFFESIGHSFFILHSRFLSLVSQLVDPEWEIFPNPRECEAAFIDFKRRNVPGFYFGSRIELPPIGAFAIFEGQARFLQLQYLHFVSGRKQDWNDFKDTGRLEGVYVEAFDCFLRVLGETYPESIDHPLVALFLLVCDLAINPSEGFPLPIEDLEFALQFMDPGYRFLALCMQIRDKFPKLKHAITSYSRDEYVRISELLSFSIHCQSPVVVGNCVRSWENRSRLVRELLEGDDSFAFKPINPPLRLFLARFIRFQCDKVDFPEFFVWTGAHAMSAGDGSNVDRGLRLFERHGPLFLDAPDGEVRPRRIPARSEEAVMNTFHEFFSFNACYDLVRQWHVCEGPFDLNFRWLTPKYTDAEMHSWASSVFQKAFGVHPSDFIEL